jgi:uridine kinase
LTSPAAGPRRAKTVGRIADHLVARHAGHPLRVAIDGVSAAGKSTIAAELTGAVWRRGRPAIHLSTDDFHHRRVHRYRQGCDSSIGYYRDAFDLDSFARLVLVPLGPGGDGRYTGRILDLESDQPIDDEFNQAPEDAVLIVDGSFLQRTELASLWDEVVFVDTSDDVARARGARRDAARFGGQAEAERALDTRYLPACRLYRDEVDPVGRATVVLDNDDLDHPILRRIGGTATDTARLFSYGTLQKPEVQTSSFGRLLDGTPDMLTGHRAGWVTITDPEVIAASGSDRHPIVVCTGRPEDTVPGTVFTISPVELAAADNYEVEDYRRVLARLGSGTDSWVYVAAGGGRR